MKIIFNKKQRIECMAFNMPYFCKKSNTLMLNIPFVKMGERKTLKNVSINLNRINSISIDNLMLVKEWNFLLCLFLQNNV